MEFKGTIGKWEITYGHPNGEEIDALRIQNDGVIRWDICAVWNDLRTEEESKANALLISKSPELLEMLQKVVLMTETCNGTFEDFRERYNIEIKQLIKQATEL